MSTIAELSVAITARTGKFTQGMDSASKGVNAFALKQRDVKQALGVFAEALGRSGGAVTTLGHSLIEFGPIVGAVVGAVALFNRVTETQAENAKNNEQNAAAYAKILKEIGELTGTLQIPGIFTQASAGLIDQMNQELEKLHKQYELVSNDWLQSGDQLVVLTKQIDKYRDSQAELLKLQQQTRPADLAEMIFSEGMFEAKTMEGGPLLSLIKQSEVLYDNVQSLEEVLAGLEPNGAAYEKVLGQWRGRYLEALGVADQIAEKQKEMLKDDPGGKYFKELGKKAEQALKDAQTPMEKYASQVEDLMEMFGAGVIDLEQFTKIAEDAATDQFKQDKKKQQDKVNRNLSQQISSRVSLEGMGRMQREKVEIMSPELVQANNYLKEILAKIGGDSAAVVQ